MATNTLGYYNPQFYANEGLIQLNKVLGMAGRVYKNYDQERRKYKLGDTINIRRPSVFTAQTAPSVAQNVTTDSVQMTLTNWKDVRFTLTDQELAYTGERIITDHINPAAIALADDIDQALSLLYKDIPWIYDAANVNGSGALTDLTGTRKIMFDNKGPVYDTPNMFLMLGSTLEAGYLAQSAFAQQQGAADVGVQTQMRGSLGPKYGFNIFSNQNVFTHTQGTFANTVSLTVTTTIAAGATAVGMTSGGTLTGTLVKGDTFVIAGNTQRYTVTATATASGNAFASVSFAPAAVQSYTNGTAINITATGALGLTNTANTSGGTNIQNLAFHRNAFAIAFAELSTLGNELGAKVATAVDPITGLALRARMYYDGPNSAVNVVLDVLYGVKTLNANLGVRLRS